MDRRAIGKRYEELAADFLQGRGYEILERNYSRRFGEIDLIADHFGCIVFIEVKYRRSIRFGYPEEAVNIKKRNRMRALAKYFLLEKNYRSDMPVRFDVVTFTGKRLRVYENAF